MYLTRDVPASEYELYMAEGITGVLWHRLLNPDNSSQKFAMRCYIIQPGGHTSYDTHEHEHGVYMMSGSIRVKVGNEMITLKRGDVIHIASNEPHQFINDGASPAKFLCVRTFE